ncbi:MAG: hypothetical protein WCZ86_00405 [Desulfurivibrionaceae bacterium]
MMKKTKPLLLILAVACALSACMTAQQIRDRRIASSQDIFNSFSPEIQQKIRAGQIELGFSEEMVRLAWGMPDRIYTRTTDKGEATVWTYSKTRILTQTDRMTIPVQVRDKSGRSSVQYENVWVNRDTREEYTVARVEFNEGMVTALERLDM